MVKGIDWFSRLRLRMPPNTERICSKRRATSRPLLAPASVITVKCGEWTAIQGEGSAAYTNEQRRTVRSAMCNEMSRRRDIRTEGSDLQENAITPRRTQMSTFALAGWLLQKRFCKIGRA